MKKLIKGNEAVVIGSLVAGCDAFFGYPTTPASEITQKASFYYPKLNKIFLQAESEIGAINMVFGASTAGLRAMTASPGSEISLKQETISYLAGSQLPCVIADITRAGFGLGNIGLEQSDYFQLIKSGGYGSYRIITLAPNSVEEMYLFTIKAFQLADKYQTPVYLAADATLGQMMESVEIHEMETEAEPKDWKLDTHPETNQNLITSIFLDFDEMETHIRELNIKFKQIESVETMAEAYLTEDAEIILTGYGIITRLLKSVIDELREKGIRAGMVRSQTLWPFPEKELIDFSKNCNQILVVELTTGEFMEDVRLSLPEKDITFLGGTDGNLPKQSEIIERVYQQLRG